MSAHHVELPEQVVTPGEELWVKIIDLDLQRRRISLSIKQAAEGGIVAAEYQEHFGEHAYDAEGTFIGGESSEGQEAWADMYTEEKPADDADPAAEAAEAATSTEEAAEVAEAVEAAEVVEDATSTEDVAEDVETAEATVSTEDVAEDVEAATSTEEVVEAVEEVEAAVSTEEVAEAVEATESDTTEV
jgi:small subunit ribosomal protein S1